MYYPIAIIESKIKEVTHAEKYIHWIIKTD